MSDIRCKTIRPVIQEDFVVTGIGERNCTVELKRWTAFI